MLATLTDSGPVQASDDETCHTVAADDQNFALCGANVSAHEWCAAPCPHVACPTCEAVLYDEKAA